MRSRALFASLLPLALLAALAVSLAALYTAAARANGDYAAETTSDLVQRARLNMLARDGYPGTVPYTVQPGDTLLSIAQQHGTTAATAALLNGLSDTEQLRPGDVLFLPLGTP
jgi:hypothetical protein